MESLRLLTDYFIRRNELLELEDIFATRFIQNKFKNTATLDRMYSIPMRGLCNGLPKAQICRKKQTFCVRRVWKIGTEYRHCRYRRYFFLSVASLLFCKISMSLLLLKYRVPSSDQLYRVNTAIQAFFIAIFKYSRIRLHRHLKGQRKSVDIAKLS